MQLTFRPRTRFALTSKAVLIKITEPAWVIFALGFDFNRYRAFRYVVKRIVGVKNIGDRIQIVFFFFFEGSHL